jgi:hypothetical protein
MPPNAIKAVFTVAAVYDFVLGAVFGLFYRPIYQYAGSVLPNHPGYVQLPALLIMTFGVGFWMVAANPERNAAIIPLGILMKASFCLVVFGHLLFGRSIPFYIPFAVIDLIFAVLFLAAYRSVQTPNSSR